MQAFRLKWHLATRLIRVIDKWIFRNSFKFSVNLKFIMKSLLSGQKKRPTDATILPKLMCSQSSVLLVTHIFFTTMVFHHHLHNIKKAANLQAHKKACYLRLDSRQRGSLMMTKAVLEKKRWVVVGLIVHIEIYFYVRYI